ncbi:hypothetical protein [Xanthomonas theicola]|uniref:Uncharacterized protein n=1 Tax=Xanthomonas theicola TaxID=56464 RepID=A0A2S6ZL61_9XANT|nr:hypothetical protein [Xanthomonas theicola]PPT92850.1 hypothetical protein XthCFBP4691_02425 [Xanthomonas theicola]QNH25681.1 hypothetical protein G4Q83_14235 [Xanthomonas theicola]
MNLLNHAQPKSAEHTETGPFRSEVRSSVVGNAALKTTALTGLRADGVKVSEYRLEQYLNACSPTCHG